MPSRARTFTHTAMPTLPWNTPASGPVKTSSKKGRASRLPVTVPRTHPATAGTEIIVRYTATTCPGVKPRAFRMPMCRKPEMTAPLTTLATISTATTMPRTPKAIR